MSNTQALVHALRKEMKDLGWTYAQLANAVGLSESSIKRMFSKGEMSLSRIDQICAALKIDFTDIARRIVEAEPLQASLSAEAEKALVADSKLLLVGICVLSQWSFEQILETYAFETPQLVQAFAALDRLGIIELKAHNRYRLRLAKTFRWRPHGDVMRYFREHALDDYFQGGFERPGEALILVHGAINRTLAPVFVEQLQRLAQDFSRQHLTDRKMASDERDGYTLLLAMRGWEFAVFRQWKRDPNQSLINRRG